MHRQISNISSTRILNSNRRLCRAVMGRHAHRCAWKRTLLRSLMRVGGPLRGASGMGNGSPSRSAIFRSKLTFRALTAGLRHTPFTFNGCVSFSRSRNRPAVAAAMTPSDPGSWNECVELSFFLVEGTTRPKWDRLAVRRQRVAVGRRHCHSRALFVRTTS